MALTKLFRFPGLQPELLYITLSGQKNPDAVVLDIFWPEVAGEQFCDRTRGMEVSMNALKSLRQINKEIPVICHTVKPSKRIMENAHENGTTFFMEKISVTIPEV